MYQKDRFKFGTNVYLLANVNVKKVSISVISHRFCYTTIYESMGDIQMSTPFLVTSESISGLYVLFLHKYGGVFLSYDTPLAENELRDRSCQFQ